MRFKFERHDPQKGRSRFWGLFFIMSLSPCLGFYPDDTKILTESPRVDVYEDVLYIPPFPGGVQAKTWGLFGRDRRLLPGSELLRGPGPYLQLQSPITDYPIDDIVESTDKEFVYAGLINPHFGHFLIESFCRFWDFKIQPDAGGNVLYHGYHTNEQIFSYPFIADMFNSIGFNREQFVRFDRPTWIRRVTVYHPSFIELHVAHTKFVELCRAVGRHLTGEAVAAKETQPVYYTKMYLHGGVQRIRNEDAVASSLSQRGVKIVAPERLDFASQIRLMRTHQVLCGAAGSVFHGSLFCEPRRFIILNGTELIPANYQMIDCLCNNNSTYLFQNNVELISPGNGFVTEYVLRDPVAVADELLFMIERECSAL